MMMPTWMTQKMPKAIHVLPGTAAHAGKAAASSAFSARPPIHV